MILIFNFALLDTQTTVEAMKVAAITLKAENKKVNISEIEDLQDDMQDMLEDMNEITESLGRSYCTEGVDEDDLEAELAMLQDDLESDEIDAGQQSSFLNTSNLPDAPSMDNILYPNAPMTTPHTVIGNAQTQDELDEYSMRN